MLILGLVQMSSIMLSVIRLNVIMPRVAVVASFAGDAFRRLLTIPTIKILIFLAKKIELKLFLF